ncbi:MAG: hypothetical protein ABGX71_06545 [Methyloprofundus sp.]|nr:hypothetical protein [Methyloprofundus sp.]
MGLQTPKSWYEISDYPIPDSFPRIPNGAELQAYFENYAKDYNVYNKISFNTCVTELEQQTNGQWNIQINNDKTGKKATKTYDFVVVLQDFILTLISLNFLIKKNLKVRYYILMNTNPLH